MNMQYPKYQKKSKYISSAEPNYFVHFAMRYPVDRINVLLDKLQAHFAKIGRNDIFYIIVYSPKIQFKIVSSKF